MTHVQIADVGGATMNMVDVGGFLQPVFMKTPEEIKKIFENVPKFKFRDDDLMLCTFPKTGTNWMFEILMMILKKSSERVTANKVQTMLECMSEEEVNKVPSPRVVNCHYLPKYLPIEGMREKQTKTIICLRNPKDTAVSLYNHMVGMKASGYSGNWKDWLPVYTEGKLEYGKYSEYLLDWERLVDNGAGFPLHIVYYEDLKMKGMQEMDRLLTFLNINLDEKLKTEIFDNCGFEKMAKDKFDKNVSEIFMKPDFSFFRKGQVGDWKNWFTVAENEQFSEVWDKEMTNSKRFTFTYTGS